MIRKLKLTMTAVALLIAASTFAQSAESLYKAGKKLYDAENYDQAFPKLKAAADKGHKKAQYRVGLCYDKGRGVAEDDQQAVAWYQKSAAQDYAKAQYQLGKCYKNGEGVAKDERKAVELFLKAAKQENGDAQYQLAKCYLKGKGVPKDEAKAKSWLRKAVKNEKDGKEIRADIEKDAANGKDDAKRLKELM
ncbi:MAG: sel1 repeat family protein [Prevotella sp.]|nr:sel1 repeat family protein [Prevotella sp.]